MAAVAFFAPTAPAQVMQDGERVYPLNQWIVGLYRVPMTMSGELYDAEVVQVDYDLQFVVVQVVNPLFFVKVQLDENVRYVEWDDPNWAQTLFVPNDSRYGDAGHWGSKKIGGEAAWDKTRGTTAVKVGMLDTGLNKGHEEYSGQSRVLQGFDFYNNDNDPNEISACNYHGTHTTGTAGATINNGKGIAGMSQHLILPVRAFGGSLCGGSSTALTNGLKYIGDQGSHLSSNSWGSSASSTAFNDAVQYSHNKGVTHVAAAGNSGPCTNCVSFPWKDKASIVIVVASTTSSDTQSSFSSEGPQVDVAAPGSSILSTTSGTAGYSSYSGTSMATPHVAGTLALVKALNSGFAFADLDSCIKNTALDLGPGGFDNDFGYGRIRADQAVNCGGSPPPPACSDGIDNDGDGLIDYPADPGCTSSTDTDETDPPPGNPTSLSENFDDGVANGWTLSGLWRVSGACTGSEPSAPNVLNYNQAPSPCNYSTGARTTGSAQTPAIDISAAASPTVSITHGYIKENYAGGDFDIMRVQVQTAGSTTWTTLWQRDSTDPDQGTWTPLSLSLTSYKSTGTKVRFFFDSVDSFDNAYLGWVLDNVVIQ